jgi:hypothetical protein
MQTVKLFHEQELRFPRRIRHGLNKGDLHWVRAAHSRVLQVLHNPRYAGAFVYGRVRTRRLPDGKHSTTRVARSEWQFVIPGVHEQLLSLATDFPRVWNDPSVEPRERKRILRLLVEDVTLINGKLIQVHVRLRGGATRSLTLDKPLPIAQIRKTKPEVVAEIDTLLDYYCDREVADVLNRQGRRTWQDELFNLKKIAHIRQAFNLQGAPADCEPGACSPPKR